MEREYSKPLTEIPSFLSTVSMVVDDRASIIKSLVQAERKSPPIYDPARELFRTVLEGSFTVQRAAEQAGRLVDTTERKVALEIIRASSDFLHREPPAPIGLFPAMDVSLPSGMRLAVSPIWLRHLAPERLMILHFWQTPLSPRQLSAAAAVLRKALLRHQPKYLDCELDFISVSQPANLSRRRFDRYNWSTLKPLTDHEFGRFWHQFSSAWSEYQRRGPREISRRRYPDMFG